jgi:hypothetical protein
VKPPGKAERAMTPSDHPAHARLVKIDSANHRLAHLRCSREILQHIIGDETLIDATKGIEKSLEHAFKEENDLRKLLQGATAIQLLCVVCDGLDAK